MGPEPGTMPVPDRPRRDARAPQPHDSPRRARRLARRVPDGGGDRGASRRGRPAPNEAPEGHQPGPREPRPGPRPAEQAALRGREGPHAQDDPPWRALRPPEPRRAPRAVRLERHRRRRRGLSRHLQPDDETMDEINSTT